jgi:hypothetical protein
MNGAATRFCYKYFFMGVNSRTPKPLQFRLQEPEIGRAADPKLQSRFV